MYAVAAVVADTSVVQLAFVIAYVVAVAMAAVQRYCSSCCGD